MTRAFTRASAGSSRMEARLPGSNPVTFSSIGGATDSTGCAGAGAAGGATAARDGNGAARPAGAAVRGERAMHPDEAMKPITAAVSAQPKGSLIRPPYLRLIDTERDAIPPRQARPWQPLPP